MNPRQFRWIFIGVLAAFVIVLGVADDSAVGVSIVRTGNSYRFAGGTEPWALVVSIMVVGFYVLLMYAPPRELGPCLRGVLRRFVAFWLDFAVGMTAIAPLVGLLPMLAEWRRTGVLQWQIARSTPAIGDEIVMVTGFLLSVVAILIYYTIPLTFGRPSPGSCILGYQIVSDEGKRLNFTKAMTRALYALIALLFAFLTPFFGRDRENGKIWPDGVLRTRAVMLN